jgi:ribosome maturation factor RimP
MRIAHEKLAGLPRERILDALSPVLTAHGVDCVELVWRSDRGERLLEVTVERPGTTEPGAGVTLELCTEISRDLSAALDVADCIEGRYRLEVGSPGVERNLYGAADFQRFVGHTARLKLKQPVAGQFVLVGTLEGVDDAERVVLNVRGEPIGIGLGDVDGARLVFEWSRGTAWPSQQEDSACIRLGTQSVRAENGVGERDGSANGELRRRSRDDR